MFRSWTQLIVVAGTALGVLGLIATGVWYLIHA